MSHVDGNAIVGPLSLALGTDAALARLTCRACGLDHLVAEAHVYLRAPGIVIRCPSCGNAEIVLVELEHRVQITTMGVERLVLGGSEASGAGPAD